MAQMAGAVVGVVGGVVQSGMGAYEWQEGKSAAKAARDSAIQNWMGLQTPAVSDLQVQLERAVIAGQLDPMDAQAILQEATGMKDIYVDPRSRNAQMEVLQEMQGIAGAEGLDDRAKFRYNQIINDLATEERGSREAILANARARGVGGSGLELQAQLMAQQGGANRASQQGFQTAAESEQRRNEALAAIAQLGGNINASEFGQQSATAQAQDIINNFNTRNRQDVLNQNVQNENQARLWNLSNAQNVANMNTAIANQQRTANAGAYQTDFLNRMAKTQGITGQQANAAQAAQIQSAAGLQMLGSGLQASAGSAGGTDWGSLFGSSGGGGGASAAQIEGVMV